MKKIWILFCTTVWSKSKLRGYFDDLKRKSQGFCPWLSSYPGRGERIRTSGLYVPNVALYQAKLHPVLLRRRIIPAGSGAVKREGEINSAAALDGEAGQDGERLFLWGVGQLGKTGLCGLCFGVCDLV